jgi:hypothetical protein
MPGLVNNPLKSKHPNVFTVKVYTLRNKMLTKYIFLANKTVGPQYHLTYGNFQHEYKLKN